MRIGERVTLEIKRLSTGGEGVGHVDGMVVFIPYAAKGDRLEIEITQTQKRFARGRILNLIEPSKDRVSPPCPYHYVSSSESRVPGSSNAKPETRNPKRLFCGGCTLQHLTYDAQLRAKRDFVQETLERIGGLKGITVKPVLGMKDPWRYRNKVQQPVGWDPAPHFPRKRDQPPSTHRSSKPCSRGRAQALRLPGRPAPAAHG